jgi:hypothetical protein
MGEIHQRHLDAIFAAMQRLDAGEIDIAQAKQQLNLL